MKRRRSIALGVVIAAAMAGVFFLPLVPVRVEVNPCLPCAHPYVNMEEQGYSSVGLYFFGYGGIYLTTLPNSYANYVGYCVVYGAFTSTSCGIGVGLLNST